MRETKPLDKKVNNISKYSESISRIVGERGKDFWKKYRGKDEGEEGHLEIMASFCTSPTIFSFNRGGGRNSLNDLGRKVNNFSPTIVIYPSSLIYAFFSSIESWQILLKNRAEVLFEIWEI